MLKNIIRWFISLGLLAFLFYVMRNNLPSILSTLKHANLPIVAGAFLMFVAALWLAAKRLQIIFFARDTSIGFWHCSNLVFIGYFFNNFLPTSIGGDVVKAMCASKITGDGVRAVTSILTDRIFGLFTFVLIPSFSFFFLLKSNQNPAVPLIIYSFLAVSILGFFLIFNRTVARRLGFVTRFLDRYSIGDKIRKLYEEVHGFKNQKSVVAKIMILSLVSQSLMFVVIYLLAVSLGVQASILQFFILIPIVLLISMLPSINGLGIREGATIYFLSPYIGKDNALAVGVLWLAMIFLLSVIGGVIYLLKPAYHVRFGANQPSTGSKS